MGNLRAQAKLAPTGVKSPDPSYPPDWETPSRAHAPHRRRTPPVKREPGRVRGEERSVVAALASFMFDRTVHENRSGSFTLIDLAAVRRSPGAHPSSEAARSHLGGPGGSRPRRAACQPAATCPVPCYLCAVFSGTRGTLCRALAYGAHAEACSSSPSAAEV